MNHLIYLTIKTHWIIPMDFSRLLYIHLLHIEYVCINSLRAYCVSSTEQSILLS